MNILLLYKNPGSKVSINIRLQDKRTRLSQKKTERLFSYIGYIQNLRLLDFWR